MKLHLRILFFVCCFLFISSLHSQPNSFGGSIIPLKPESPLFGKDIVIQDSSSLDQRNVAICSAFNGWLYAVYAYSQPDHGYITILKSTDNGINWNVIGNGSVTFFSGEVITKLNILACGSSVANLKLFVGWVFLDTVIHVSQAQVCRFNPDPFVFEAEILNDGNEINDLALKDDYNYPATNSNPFSLAVLYSKHGIQDSIIFRTSSNGGMSFDSRHVVDITTRHFNKVALNYGRSPSWGSGRYFAAWESKVNTNSSTGHIYTAHTEPNFNSSLTYRICLDSLDPSTINKVRNPVIACQYNNVDNDSANFTEVVMFDKYLSSTHSYDLEGWYNLQPTTSRFFKNFSISSPGNYHTESDINFNPYSSTFMLTYYDSTNQKLPYLTNDFNFSNPNSWTNVSSAYNDNNKLKAPYPKVEIDYGQQDAINVWSSEGTDGNGIALFDAPYSTYTGIPVNSNENNEFNCKVYPNPCNTSFSIYFELTSTENVTIILSSLCGQQVKILADNTYQKGNHRLTFNVLEESQGCYLYKIIAGNQVKTGKLVIIR